MALFENADCLDVKDLFSDIKYYITGTLSERALQLLVSGGAKQEYHITDLMTHLIVGTDANENEISVVKDIYEKPVVAEKWVLLSAKCSIQLPVDAFSPDPHQVFSGVVACISQLSKTDALALWALITYNGGVCSLTLTELCTHLITGQPDGEKYRAALRHSHRIHIVTPDWVVACANNKLRSAETNFHPRLLVVSTPPTPTRNYDLLCRNTLLGATGPSVPVSEESTMNQEVQKIKESLLSYSLNEPVVSTSITSMTNMKAETVVPPRASSLDFSDEDISDVECKKGSLLETLRIYRSQQKAKSSSSQMSPGSYPVSESLKLLSHNLQEQATGTGAPTASTATVACDTSASSSLNYGCINAPSAAISSISKASVYCSQSSGFDNFSAPTSVSNFPVSSLANTVASGQPVVVSNISQAQDFNSGNLENVVVGMSEIPVTSNTSSVNQLKNFNACGLNDRQQEPQFSLSSDVQHSTNFKTAVGQPATEAVLHVPPDRGPRMPSEMMDIVMAQSSGIVCSSQLPLKTDPSVSQVTSRIANTGAILEQPIRNQSMVQSSQNASAQSSPVTVSQKNLLPQLPGEHAIITTGTGNMTQPSSSSAYVVLQSDRGASTLGASATVGTSQVVANQSFVSQHGHMYQTSVNKLTTLSATQPAVSRTDMQHPSMEKFSHESLTAPAVHSLPVSRALLHQIPVGTSVFHSSSKGESAVQQSSMYNVKFTQANTSGISALSQASDSETVFLQTSTASALPNLSFTNASHTSQNTNTGLSNQAHISQQLNTTNNQCIGVGETLLQRVSTSSSLIHNTLPNTVVSHKASGLHPQQMTVAQSSMQCSSVNSISAIGQTLAPSAVHVNKAAEGVTPYSNEYPQHPDASHSVSTNLKRDISSMPPPYTVAPSQTNSEQVVLKGAMTPNSIPQVTSQPQNSSREMSDAMMSPGHPPLFQHTQTTSTRLLPDPSPRPVPAVSAPASLTNVQHQPSHHISPSSTNLLQSSGKFKAECMPLNRIPWTN